MLVGNVAKTRSNEAWRQVYRALDHVRATEACRKQHIMKKFPRNVRAFAVALVTMQEKRHAADYDPEGNYFKSDVLTDIAFAEAAIRKFLKVIARDRRAFAVLVHFKQRQ